MQGLSKNRQSAFSLQECHYVSRALKPLCSGKLQDLAVDRPGTQNREPCCAQGKSGQKLVCKKPLQAQAVYWGKLAVDRRAFRFRNKRGFLRRGQFGSPQPLKIIVLEGKPLFAKRKGGDLARLPEGAFTTSPSNRIHGTRDVQVNGNASQLQGLALLASSSCSFERPRIRRYLPRLGRGWKAVPGPSRIRRRIAHHWR
jgi:hypothetical protein